MRIIRRLRFTSFEYGLFLVVILTLYWGVPRRTWQNALLLCGSYVFYGFIHPWFCLLLLGSTCVDFVCAQAMERSPDRRGRFLVVSCTSNLGLLATFKYFDFFSTSVAEALGALGVAASPPLLDVVLPVGISFYTFQTLGYSIDVYRGQIPARKNFLDFALFVSFFPQLVAGPIERAARLLPQIEYSRRFDVGRIASAIPLLVSGFTKKLVVADNLAVEVDRIYGLEEPSLLLLAVGTLAFAFQIWADFSAYTDMARGSARLLGFDLMENFRAPYLAISPSDFWRRWHVSFSSWIRDYLYIPLGGSRGDTARRFLFVVVVTMGLSGLWHGAAWHFVAWGVYHALILFAYHQLGLGGRWKPGSRGTNALAWAAMSILTLFGWSLFRAPTLAWLADVLTGAPLGLGGDAGTAASMVLATTLVYSSFLGLPALAARVAPRWPALQGALLAVMLGLILALHRDEQQDFIYFQF